MKFDHSFLTLPSDFYSYSKPSIFDRPELIIFNHSLARELGFNAEVFDANELAKIFSGQINLPGSTFFSQVYAGHQFGHFVPRLGDGRAILLGEVITDNNERFDMQLKGAGPTEFSRRGDGFSALGPVLREYLVSEFMHSVSIKTTRALCAVKTHRKVQRELVLDGGVFTRIAKSHIRIGTFQYFLAKNDVLNLQRLLDYAINRHFPHLKSHPQYSKERTLLFLSEVIAAQTDLISEWMGIGFIHGVMNTDNTSISGDTIDYGPCAFMDQFNFNQVYSFIDQQGRYAYSQQPMIISWNLARLADCLIPILSLDQNINSEQAIEYLNDSLAIIIPLLESKSLDKFKEKLFLHSATQEEQKKFVAQLLTTLEASGLDYTLSFRQLSQKLIAHETTLPEGLEAFLKEWKSFLISNHIDLNLAHDSMNKINPHYIPRNHLVEKAIERAYGGDFSYFHQLHQVLKNPFNENKLYEQFAKPPSSEEVIANTFCGT